MTYARLALLTLVVLLGACSREAPATTSLADARKGFKTALTHQGHSDQPVDIPPPNGPFKLITYPAGPGSFAAYITADPRDAQRHPAIVWITGGDCNSIGDVWSPAERSNDQSASAYRAAGIVMMFPSLRGGNKNPGTHEGFLGEVDDVIAAADYLSRQPYVDPKGCTSNL